MIKIENIIEIYNITKTIKKRKILNNVGFKIKKNSIFGIVGPNGSGKTTLLRILMGLYTPTIGFFKLKGICNKDKLNYDDVSALIENPKFYEYLTGRENLRLINILHNNEYDINKIIEKLNLSSFIDKKVKTYSLGMKQKLSIAICLINKPKILILDEPTNGFDPGEVIKFKKLVKELTNITIIICTHDLNIISSLCDEVLFIKQGRVVDIKKKPFEKELVNLFEVSE